MNRKKILLAQAVKTKGLKGEVKLKVYTENSSSIVDYTLIDESEVVYEITNANFFINFVIVKFKGIDSREAAENIIGKRFYTYHENLPKLQEDSYYITDLIGLKLVNSNNEVVGTIIAAHNFGAGDIIEIKTNSNNTFMLPFDNEIIINVDMSKGEISLGDGYKEYM